MNIEHPVAALAQLCIGVADMAEVRRLWIDQFGLEILAERAGADAELERLWGLQPGAVSAQLLLRTPDAPTGWLHFVEFAAPGRPVRGDAAPTDLCPKNIDVNCVNIAARCRELEAAGAQFRSAISEYTLDGVAAREVQMPAHDDINVVLIEVDGMPIRLSSRQYGAVTSFITTVNDLDAEESFYACLFGFERLMAHRIAGPAIEQAVGLASGAALQMRLLGATDQPYGRVELIHYEGSHGRDLYPLAAAPARGIIGARWATTDCTALLRRAARQGFAARDRGRFVTLAGEARVVQVTSPAGLRIEVVQFD